MTFPNLNSAIVKSHLKYNPFIQENDYESFLPNQIAGNVLWLDGNDPSANGIQPANNAAISSWKDKSGNNFNAVQGTGAQQPLYKKNIQNSLPSILFDGANDCLTIPNFAVGSNITFFLAAKVNVSLLVEQSADAAANNGFWFYSGNGSHLRNGGSNLDSFPGGAWMGTSFVSGSFSYNGTTLTTYLNGSSVATGSGAITNNTVTATLNIGARNNGSSLASNAYFAEMIVYNRFLSITERTKVQNYLSSKWGV